MSHLKKKKNSSHFIGSTLTALCGRRLFTIPPFSNQGEGTWGKNKRRGPERGRKEEGKESRNGKKIERGKSGMKADNEGKNFQVTFLE